MPELVRVTHPQVGEALVPPSALRQLDPAWRLVEDEPDTPAPDEDDKPARRPRKGSN